MDKPKSIQVANLKIQLALLQKEEGRLHDIIRFSDKPDYVQSAHVDLARCLENIRKTAQEINQLESSL